MNLKELEWKILESTKIEKISYYENNLYVVFKNKKDNYSAFIEIYEYLDVPKDIYQRIINREFFSARDNLPSYGATLYYLVQKDEKYKFNKIKERQNY